MKKRNINIDLIKCIAVFSVISVHFFANTGFYDKTILGNNMYTAVFFRTLFCLLISSLINIYISKGNTFVWGIHNEYSSILNVSTSVLIFILITNLDLQKLNIKLKKIITKLSELSLGLYLTSGTIDRFLYFNYFKNVDFFSIIGYFKIVPLIFVLSISLSIIINVIYKIINKYIIKKIAISL